LVSSTKSVIQFRALKRRVTKIELFLRRLREFVKRLFDLVFPRERESVVAVVALNHRNL